MQSVGNKTRADIIDYMNSLLTSAWVIEEICAQNNDEKTFLAMREIRKVGLRAMYDFVVKEDPRRQSNG